MEHRKRHAMQHKVELPTLLKLTLATMEKKNIQSTVKITPGLANTLAREALETLKESDRQLVPEVEEEMYG